MVDEFIGLDVDDKYSLKDHLDGLAAHYEQPGFIELDPISIPHQFSKKQDIEIAAFWTAMLAWGQRVTIINKSKALMSLMGDSPHDFIVNHKEKDRSQFLEWKHRTFQPTDTLYFLAFLQHHYREHESLEGAFSSKLSLDADPKSSTVKHSESDDMYQMLSGFHDYFFSLEDAPQRTKKHVATPRKKATCKRLNMFLRWMVRSSDRGVDFGLWNKIKPSQLVIPMDVHVERIARKLGLLTQKQVNWNAAVEVTEALKIFDPEDPVKYDYALFGSAVAHANHDQIK